jgi:hypothetical protein
LVPAFAARISPELASALTRMTRRGLSPAEITRRIGDLAQRQGSPRPSYARVRQLVLEHRAAARLEEESWGQLLLEVDLRAKPPDVLLAKAAGTLWRGYEDAGVD